MSTESEMHIELHFITYVCCLTVFDHGALKCISIFSIILIVAAENDVCVECQILKSMHLKHVEMCQIGTCQILSNRSDRIRGVLHKGGFHYGKITYQSYKQLISFGTKGGHYLKGPLLSLSCTHIQSVVSEHTSLGEGRFYVHRREVLPVADYIL